MGSKISGKMVSAVVLTSAIVISTPVAGTAALAGASIGAYFTTVGTITGASTAATVVGSAGAGLATGAISGSVAGGTAASTTIGSAVGLTAAVGVTSTSVGASATAAGLAIGPLLLILGCSQELSKQMFTFDCWKPVLHDESIEPSKGILFKYVIQDARIRTVKTSGNSFFPKIIVENIWNEQFLIKYVTLPSMDIALHAVQLT